MFLVCDYVSLPTLLLLWKGLTVVSSPAVEGHLAGPVVLSVMYMAAVNTCVYRFSCELVWVILAKEKVLNSMGFSFALFFLSSLRFDLLYSPG